ncbi:hypothetical protein ACWD4G_35740 [Streptomyces sp. NPDC002643]
MCALSDSTPGEPTPEDGEPTSFVENAKNLIKKHKGKILAVGGAVGSVALAVVVASLAERRDAEDQEPLSAPEITDAPRRSPSAYDVDPHPRKLPDGVNGWSYPGDSPEDEDPGEAAA